MDPAKNLIKTLTIKQLLIRWPHYSRANIFELADEGCFGVYVNHLVKRKTYYHVNKSIEKLVHAHSISDSEREHYIDLNKRFIEFTTLKSDLIEAKSGYSRLATKVETEIFPLCETTSIQRMIRCKKIDFFDFNNTFGFEKNDLGFVANSYLLMHMSNGVMPLPTGYKGYFADEDIFFFIDQVIKFENENKELFTQLEDSRNDEHSKQDHIDGTNSAVVLDGTLSEQGANKAFFLRHGNNYKILYQCKEIIIDATKGARYIEHLIKNPNKYVHVNDLALLGHKDSPESKMINADQCEDHSVTASYNTSEPSLQINPSQIKTLLNEIDNLDAEIDCAEKDGDFELIDDLKNKKEKIEDYLNKSSFNGKPRKFIDDGERRRQAIQKSIKTALAYIKKEHNELYEHLEKGIKTGFDCVYNPDSNILWQ